DMRPITSGILGAVAVVAAFAVTSVSAQAQNVRVRGTIEKVDGNVVTVKSREGGELKLTLKDNANIRGVVKASLADVKAATNVARKPGLTVSVAGAPKLPDGSLDVGAIQVEKEIPPPR